VSTLAQSVTESVMESWATCWFKVQLFCLLFFVLGLQVVDFVCSHMTRVEKSTTNRTERRDFFSKACAIFAIQKVAVSKLP